MGCLRTLVAITTITLPEPTYTFDYGISVEENVVCDFENLDNIQSTDIVSNKGGLAIEAQEGAILSFLGLFNSAHAWTSISGAGELLVTFLSALGIARFSYYQVTAEGNLDFNVYDCDQTYTNEGLMTLNSLTAIALHSPRDFVNKGKLILLSAGTGQFVYGRIYNVDEWELRANSDADILTFDDLYNDGKLSFAFGEGTGITVDARGIVDNTGIIEIHGSGGQGRIKHTDLIQNDGLMCLKQSHLYHSAKVAGNGCWFLTESAYIEIDWSHKFSNSQRIIFGDVSAYIMIRNLANTRVIYDVYGVMSGSTPFRSHVEVNEIVYEERAGILLILQDLEHFAAFDIGRGYDEDGFTLFENEVSYVGTNPSMKTYPTTCKCDDPTNRFFAGEYFGEPTSEVSGSDRSPVYSNSDVGHENPYASPSELGFSFRPKMSDGSKSGRLYDDDDSNAFKSDERNFGESHSKKAKKLMNKKDSLPRFNATDLNTLDFDFVIRRARSILKRSSDTTSSNTNDKLDDDSGLDAGEGSDSHTASDYLSRLVSAAADVLNTELSSAIDDRPPLPKLKTSKTSETNTLGTSLEEVEQSGAKTELLSSAHVITTSSQTTTSAQPTSDELQFAKTSTGGLSFERSSKISLLMLLAIVIT